MKKKFNWLSIVSLAVSIVAPIANAKLTAIGVPVKIGATLHLPLMGMVFIGLNPFTLMPLIQATFALLGGISAHGAFFRGASDWRTNITGIIGAVAVLAGAFGFHATTEVQVAISAFVAKLVAYFSETPDGGEAV